MCWESHGQESLELSIVQIGLETAELRGKNLKRKNRSRRRPATGAMCVSSLKLVSRSLVLVRLRCVDDRESSEIPRTRLGRRVFRSNSEPSLETRLDHSVVKLHVGNVPNRYCHRALQPLPRARSRPTNGRRLRDKRPSSSSSSSTETETETFDSFFSSFPSSADEWGRICPDDDICLGSR